MGKWLSNLDVRVLGDRSFRLLVPLGYLDNKGIEHWTPAGQEVDFASVWNLPVASLLLAGRCNKAASRHDDDYRNGKETRLRADELLFEGAYYEEIEQGMDPNEALIIANMLYRGVRIGGKSSYKGPKEWAD